MAAAPCGPFPPQEAGHSDGRRRLALILEYDGTRYKGFQWQSQAPSIQGEVEAAIRSFTGESTRVRGASRTDSGVHATGQVVDFLSGSTHTTQTFVNALNWYLPPDIRVRGAWDTSLGFNSRKDAVSRVVPVYVAERQMAIGPDAELLGVGIITAGYSQYGGSGRLPGGHP